MTLERSRNQRDVWKLWKVRPFLVKKKSWGRGREGREEGVQKNRQEGGLPDVALVKMLKNWKREDDGKKKKSLGKGGHGVSHEGTLTNGL